MKISASFLKIQDQKANIVKLNSLADYMHFDIMDGHFVKGKTLDFDELLEVSKELEKPKDVHLMVNDIYEYIDMYSKINPEFITFHIEATNEPLKVIDYIKAKNINVGISLNPATNVETLIPYLDKVDLVLVMSVVPGKGGQPFIDITDKLIYLDNYRKSNNLNYLIEVDGGINDQTISKVINADIAVVGSFITDSDNYKEQFEKLWRQL